jgi:hypothetical protein
MDTIIISAFPCCGKTYAFNNYQDTYKILDSDSSNFSWMERVRTEEELEKEKEIWNSTEHLLSADGWINKIKNELIKVRDPEFPKNYIEHIKENIGKVDFIFVSSHLQVRQALTDNNIEFCTVYPEPNCLDEWIGRMYRRGNDKAFIDFQIKNWEKFVNDVNDEPHGDFLYRLGHNQYLSQWHLKMITGYFLFNKGAMEK